MEFCRKTKNEENIVAICYDFDKTLTPDDMQAQGLIQQIHGEDTKEFWDESNNLAKNNDMDQNLSYMFMLKDKSEGILPFTKEKLLQYGEKIKLFPGVDSWFDRINEYASSLNIKVEHYVISSGLKEIIEGTSIYKQNNFESVFASSFYYIIKNNTRVPIWPAQTVNYTNKTQYLFRISKGYIDVNDQAVNDYIEQKDLRIPFSKMIYIGDSDTDIPCMKIVRERGGYSIGVYDYSTNKKEKVYKMFKDRRINYYSSTDYTANSELESIVKIILNKIYNASELEKIENNCMFETQNFYNTLYIDKNETIKNDLIISLDDSLSFRNTHQIISNLSIHNNWNDTQVIELCRIALYNDQIRLIINDSDIKQFYKNLLSNRTILDSNVQEIKKMIG